MGMDYCAAASIFSDQLISATELNRQPGRVLDRALEHPVTITRNDQAFALLRREQMANLVRISAQAETVVEVISVAYQLRIGEKIDLEHPYGWLKVFDTEELTELVAEIVDAFRRCSATGDAEILDALIHEWQESASANSSSALAEAFGAEADEVPLTPPTTFDSIAQTVN